MAEITKITSPLVPRENVGNRFKPETDQAFDLNKLDKAHKAANEGRILEQRPERQALREAMGRAVIASVLRDAGDMSAIVKRLALLIETGVSATDALKGSELRELLGSVYVNPDELMSFLMEQDRSSALFKGEVFDILRDLLSRFPDNPKIRDAIAGLLKAFECNVNTPGALRTILANCANVLDYLFSQDREQFSSYLDGLARAIMPQTQEQSAQPGQTAQPEQAPAQSQTQGAAQPEQTQTTAQGQTAGSEQTQPAQGQPPPTVQGQAAQSAQTEQPPTAQGQPAGAAGTEQTQQQQPTAQGQNTQNTVAEPPPQGQNTAQQTETQPPMTHKEIAQLLKTNLLPLLGEIVVKYNQNERIREFVMVAVHNTVRVDQGTPEALRFAANRLVHELRQVANLPDDFSRNLTNTVLQASREAAQSGENRVMERLVEVISQALRSEEASPAVLRQSETLLMSMLQNESPLMDLLHYMIPIQFGGDQMIAELFIDPDNGGENGRESSDPARKLFLCFESEAHGSYEVSFLQQGNYIDFAMWCPGILVKGLSSMKRLVSNIMQTHGFTLNSYSVEEFHEPHSVAEVFPDLLKRRVGIDIRI